jgi:hypothetical protein
MNDGELVDIDDVGLDRGIPDDALRATDDGNDDLCRRRPQHHGIIGVRRIDGRQGEVPMAVSVLKLSAGLVTPSFRDDGWMFPGELAWPLR